MQYVWITFDCYGTLIDWETGIAEAFQKVARTTGNPFDRNLILQLYNKFEIQEELSYKKYRIVLQRVARRICVELGWELDNYDFLAESLPRWRPFADTNQSLEFLSTRHKLGILSNVDDDLLAATRRHFTVNFPLIITAQKAGSYKPASGHFDEARKTIGVSSWLHAAQSYFHDIVPCNRLSIDSAWINRKGEPLKDSSMKPLFNGPDLAAFCRWLQEIEA